MGCYDEGLLAVRHREGEVEVWLVDVGSCAADALALLAGAAVAGDYVELWHLPERRDGRQYRRDGDAWTLARRTAALSPEAREVARAWLGALRAGTACVGGFSLPDGTALGLGCVPQLLAA